VPYFQKAWRVALIALLLLCGASAYAQGWPTKTVRIVVPFAAGGSTDAIARLLAKKMEASTKQTVVVENISGGGSIIGAASVANAPADGASLLFTGSGTITVMKHTSPSLPIDAEATLTPVTFVNTLPHWIVVRADRPEKTFRDFMAFIKKNPGKVSISVNAIGGAAHLALAKWAALNDLDIIVVPYRGSPPAMVDLLGGVTTAHVDVIGSSIAFVTAGKAKALAVLQQEPIADLPDVAASSAEGDGGLLVSGRHVLAVRSGTPTSIVDRIYQVTEELTAEPDFVAFLKKLGFERSVPTPAQSREVLAQESKKIADIVRTTKIKLN
jgi:tripartite-type tricarboxylate transporter receptor subunit TctC